MKITEAMRLPQLPGFPTSGFSGSQLSSLLMASQASAQPADVQI